MPALRVLMSGASGLIGSAVREQLEADGHDVVQLVRRERRSSSEHRWYPDVGVVDAGLVSSADAVINLSGASTGRLPWTPAYKREILRSRIDTTRTLAEAINTSATPPATFISASAVGYYGNRPGENLFEDSSKGSGFLSDVVDVWEQSARLASHATRVVTVRTGLVVGKGGAFTPLGLLTRLGLGATLGTGAQYWPWISLHDEAAAITHMLTSTMSGAVNLAGPTPATAEVVTTTLAEAMDRGHRFTIPEPVIRLGLGEPGRELLLPSQKVIPARLVEDGFTFRHETVGDAIDAVWGARASA
jgi:uncharacterized protein (TIGR01777 family)